MDHATLIIYHLLIRFYIGDLVQIDVSAWDQGGNRHVVGQVAGVKYRHCKVTSKQ